MARDRMFTIRVDEAEHALFKGAAQAVGISISEYARDAMLARMALEELGSVDQAVGTMTRGSRAVKGRSEETPMSERQPPASLVSASSLIESPAEVPAAVERVAPGRSFSPYSKEQQTGKAAAVEVKSCRHGLLRCKVCGTG